MDMAMGRVVSRARQLRLNYQAKLGRPVTVVEVAEKTGVDRRAIARLESNDTERYDGDVLAKLCAFYGVSIEDILEYVPENKRTPSLTVAFQPGY